MKSIFIVLTLFPTLVFAQKTVLDNELNNIITVQPDGKNCSMHYLKKDSSLYTGIALSNMKHPMKVESYINGGQLSYTSYFPNHQPSKVFHFDYTETCLFVNDTLSSWQPTGAFFEFYDNGKPKILGNYIKGIQVGVWIYYDENTVIQKIETYDNKGQLQRVETLK